MAGMSVGPSAAIGEFVCLGTSPIALQQSPAPEDDWFRVGSEPHARVLIQKMVKQSGRGWLSQPSLALWLHVGCVGLAGMPLFWPNMRRSEGATMSLSDEAFLLHVPVVLFD